MLAAADRRGSRLFVLRSEQPLIHPSRGIVRRWTKLQRRSGGARGEVGMPEPVVRAAHGVVGHDAHGRGPVRPPLIRRPVIRVIGGGRGGSEDTGGFGRGLLLRPYRHERLARPEEVPYTIQTI